jgi:ABC-type transport system involved in multi-copper enzyme maturation permease subunit
VITLLGVEFSRILARRLVRVLGALALLGIMVAGVVVFIQSHPVSGPAAAALREQVRVEDPRFHLTSYADVLMGTSGLLIFLLMVVGASLVGAEWHAGTMTTILTWEPRRARLMAAKVIAASAFAFVAFLLVEALLFGGLAPAALVRGTTEGLDGTWLRSTLGFAVRAGGLGALAAAVGFSIASVARNTGAAAGVAFAYIAILEPIVRGWKPKWQPWFVYDNAATFVLGHTAGFTSDARSTLGAGLVLVAYTLGMVLIAVAAFRRRDVT